MKTKTSAHYQREYRRRLRDMGLVKKEVWILPENAKRLSTIEKTLRHPYDESAPQETALDMNEVNTWTTLSLYEGLAIEPLFNGEQASVEFIDGIEPAIHMIMHEYGDLPLFLTVVGEQILVEAVLWARDAVKDLSGFNDAVLRTHKYFPLSTISLDTLANGKDYYQMFGALSAASILPNILFEIEVLASNVIQATQAYSDYLTIPEQASV